jgi:hypothetical protein
MSRICLSNLLSYFIYGLVNHIFGYNVCGLISDRFLHDVYGRSQGSSSIKCLGGITTVALFKSNDHDRARNVCCHSLIISLLQKEKNSKEKKMHFRLSTFLCFTPFIIFDDASVPVSFASFYQIVGTCLEGI